MHVHDDLLRRFVDGALDDEVAASVAIHLDSCSRCATRAATLEPLALAFAAVDDPIVPAELPHDILTAIHAPPVPVIEPTLGAELGLALALAAAAALLVVITGDGPALMVDAAAAMGGASAAFGALSLDLVEPGAALLGLSLGAALLMALGATRDLLGRVFSPGRV